MFTLLPCLIKPQLITGKSGGPASLQQHSPFRRMQGALALTRKTALLLTGALAGLLCWSRRQILPSFQVYY